ncbi:MAG: TlpA family protein disulfide reductase [Myxococcales bacterium]|nr:TlpA family protein disulfide reductase [Myxococcales bacterium]
MTDEGEAGEGAVASPTAPAAPPERGAPAERQGRPTSPWPARLRRWGTDLALVIAVVVGVQWWHARDLVDRGTAAPPLSLTSLDGEPVELSSFAGRAVLVEFWATWCPVCRREFAALNAVASSPGCDCAVISVVDDSDDLTYLRTFVSERDIEYPVLLARPSTTRDWQVGAFPTEYVIAPDGTIASQHVGLATRWGMRLRLWMASRSG